ncbi:MAG TPA: DUF2510 domain-containing protein, partial [Acidimicrobiales bacterium]|nr:DUF2510 domain-containing protein [Acidimicrobiales bacterium]
CGMSDLVSQVGAPPGWYADPYGRAVHRYFNGAAWTPYVVDAAGQQVAESPPGPSTLAAPLSASGGGIVIQNVVQVPPAGYVIPVAGQPGTKSPGLAVGLAAVFGPLGVLYVNVGVAIVLTVLWLLFFLTLIVPFGIWVGGMVYAYTEANRRNLRRLAMAAGPQPIHGGLPPVQAWQPATAPPPPPMAAPLPSASFASMPPPPPPSVGPLAPPSRAEDTLPFA